MANKKPSEPWLSMLRVLDAAAAAPIDLHCIGGFALTAVYAAPRTTADFDVLDVAADSRTQALFALAERGSPLHQRLGVYLDPVRVATPPCDYTLRLRPIYGSAFRQLRLFVPDAYDLALLKLDRNSQRDREDVKWLAHSEKLDPVELRRRYTTELSPYLTGPIKRHDLTIELWIEMIEEMRANRKEH